MSNSAPVAIEVESPFPEFAVPRLWDWVLTFRSKVCDDYSPKTREAFVEHTLAQLRTHNSWAVARDGDIGGIVLFQPWNPRVGTMHVMFKRTFWGRSTTETALRQILSQVFGAGYEKVCAYFFEDNYALRGLVHALGGKREGWLEAQTIRNGKPVAMEAIAIFKDRFNGISLPVKPKLDADIHGSAAGNTERAQQPTASEPRQSGHVGSAVGPAQDAGHHADQ
jgi:RimJ/RimL family protein N-acetyltransferase